MEKFFAENATKPTAWSVGRGEHITFSVASDIFSKRESEIKKLASKYKLKIVKNGNLVTFIGEQIVRTESPQPIISS